MMQASLFLYLNILMWGYLFRKEIFISVDDILVSCKYNFRSETINDYSNMPYLNVNIKAEFNVEIV